MNGGEWALFLFVTVPVGIGGFFVTRWMEKERRMQIERSKIWDDFVGTTCSICEGSKKKNQSFCGKCFMALSQKKRTALYLPFGDGYEQAFIEASEYLRQALPHARERK